MDADFTLLIFYCSLALGVSFLCSILEAIVLSIPNTFVSVQVNEGKKSGQYWSYLKDDDAVRPLTAILTLNTIAHTMGAAGVGSQVQQIWGEQVLTLASVILTLAVLFLSEILPKTIGAAYWKVLSTPAAYILIALTKLFTILIVFIQLVKSIMPKGNFATVTRDDVAAMADLGEIEGAILKSEEDIIHNLLRLQETFVKEVMTPRVVVSAFDETSTIRDILDEHSILRFSRIPVYVESIDSITGVIIRSHLLMAASRDEWEVEVETLKKPILSVSTEDSLAVVLDIFLTNKEQIAIAKDDFGGTAGIITMEDVIETLLGKEIIDELDEVEDMRQLALDQATSSEE